MIYTTKRGNSFSGVISHCYTLYHMYVAVGRLSSGPAVCGFICQSSLSFTQRDRWLLFRLQLLGVYSLVASRSMTTSHRSVSLFARKDILNVGWLSDGLGLLLFFIRWKQKIQENSNFALWLRLCPLSLGTTYYTTTILPVPSISQVIVSVV